jgi:hypothetical protein
LLQFSFALKTIHISLPAHCTQGHQNLDLEKLFSPDYQVAGWGIASVAWLAHCFSFLFALHAKHISLPAHCTPDHQNLDLRVKKFAYFDYQVAGWGMACMALASTPLQFRLRSMQYTFPCLHTAPKATRIWIWRKIVFYPDYQVAGWDIASVTLASMFQILAKYPEPKGYALDGGIAKNKGVTRQIKWGEPWFSP